MEISEKQNEEIIKRLKELTTIKEKLPALVDDLYWEFDRMSSSGQETLDKIAKILSK
tara:strand:- start:93 stop:263 length:171 start_codon:yes stop_codon:yes gene_type:complete